MEDERPRFQTDALGVIVSIRVAEAAGSDSEVLRLENYDTDIPPHPNAVEATRAAIGRDEANSYLPSPGSTR